MIRSLIKNDIRANKLSSAATFFFMAVSAMFLCLTVLLGGSLLGSIDHLMKEAQTPDFLQMHAGEADEVQITAFAEEQKEVEQWQLMQIGSESLRIAGFIRDSRMNSMMASSKRFLVNEEDYARFRETGSEEYLIEFLLREGSDVDAFALAYTESNLPSNGPTITAPLIRMMNALSDGMMILVIFLVSIVALLISMLCIRFLLLTTLEKEQKVSDWLGKLG